MPPFLRCSMFKQWAVSTVRRVPFKHALVYRRELNNQPPIQREEKHYHSFDRTNEPDIRWRSELDSTSSPPPTMQDVQNHLNNFKQWKAEQSRVDTKERIKASWAAILKAILVATGMIVFPVYIVSTRQPTHVSKLGEDAIGKPDLGGKWTLVGQHGRILSSTDLRGKYQLIYFGFTYCPDICPQELEKQSRVIELLDKKFGPVVQPIFVTVDPTRDTTAQTEAYCREFHPRLLGLTGTPDQIKYVSRLFRVYYNQGIRTDDEDYLVDHSIIMYLMDRRGKFLDFFGKNMTSTEILEKIEKHLNADIERAKKKKGPRYDLGGWFWKYVDYWKWSTVRENVKRTLQRGTVTFGVSLIVVLYRFIYYFGFTPAASLMYGWSESMHRAWIHYATRERERKYLIRVIREGRERGDLPPSIIQDFVE